MAARSKQYRVLVPAGSNTNTTSIRAAPQTPGRIALWIQNTGAQPGLLRFKENVQGDGGDFAIAVGAFFPVDLSAPCPTEAINLGSAAGTTFAILEMVGEG
jgi:hypothetical protein